MSQHAVNRSARTGRRTSANAFQGKKRSSSRSRFQARPARGRQPKKAYIHPSRFVRSAQPPTEDSYVASAKFEDFAIQGVLKRNIAQMGFVTPSPIQDQTIPLGLDGKDVVGIANTGTGKTAAFAVPMLQRLLTEPISKALVLAPTRELAEQIEQQCRLIGKNSGLTGALLIGGASMGAQLRDLRQKPRIIIGTPGRIKDHLERGSLDIHDCNIVVLDEVDRMLDMGFVHDITHILGQASSARQSFYFSATLDDRVRSIIESFSKDAVHVSVKSSDTSDNVQQDVVDVHPNSTKIDTLHDILIREGTTKAIVFDDTQRSVERLAKELVDRGFKADSIHGGKSQSQRQRVLKKFKASDVTVLIATDVAARGLDVSDISHVINYSLPQSYDDYVHRIGRTGRAGKVGQALTFLDR